jgi:adenylate cyclase class 2
MDDQHAGFEVEVKFRVADHAALAARLAALGAVAGEPIEQEDLYLAHPARDFARTDEALRLRRVGGRNFVTYKGPKLGGPTKTREEVEVPFEPGRRGLEGMARVFERLGFRAVATIRKVRTPFRLSHGDRAIEVALDDAAGLGRFAEVEALACGPDDLAAAQSAVLALAAELGLGDVERRSYLRMTLEARADRG